MDSLDHFSDHPQASDVSPWSTIQYYGLLGGLIFIIFSFLGNTVGFGRPCAGFVSLAIFGLFFMVIFGFLIFAVIRKHRDDELGGYITFGRAVLVGTGAALIAAIFYAGYGYVYAAYIEPDLAVQMVDEMQVMFEELGLEDSVIDEQMADLEARMEPGAQLTSDLTSAVGIGVFFSLLFGAILKKSPPENAL